jgi:DNA (cytosine-5)-methyltransferase 1
MANGNGKSALCAAFLAKHYGGNYTGAGIDLNNPTDTITTTDHHALVSAFLLKYYGSEKNGYALDEPIHTVPTKDRFGLVTVKGENYRIIDIGMRMLQPHELFAAQGFPDDYIIDQDHTGKKFSKAAQVARCGNSVCPDLAAALVTENYSINQISEVAA